MDKLSAARSTQHAARSTLCHGRKRKHQWRPTNGFRDLDLLHCGALSVAAVAGIAHRQRQDQKYRRRCERQRKVPMKIALGADHAGFELKELVKKLLMELKHEAADLGTFS